MLRGSNKRKYLQILLGIFITIWAALAIAPVYRFDWFLENILVFIAVPFTLYIHKKSPLSALSYTLIFIFLVVHCYGAHYTYSETPLGKYVSNALALERNHYDRFVHFMWGFMLTIPVFELLQKKISSRKVKTVFIFACSILLSFGVAYEFMEWWTAIIVAPEAGTAFLGTQGDEWDAQKDLLLGFLGSVASIIFLPFCKN